MSSWYRTRVGYSVPFLALNLSSVRIVLGLLVPEVMEGICWKEELFHAHFNNKNEFVATVDNVTRLSEHFEVIGLVSVWKEECNYYFKHGKFGFAFDQYEKVAKYMFCTYMMSTVDSIECKDLAIALNLNLAACSLKLGSFQQVMELCSPVININPKIVKARSRRAKVAMKVDLTALTFRDLTKAEKLEPTNKEIQNALGLCSFLNQLSKVRKSLTTLILRREVGMVPSLEKGIWIPRV